MKQLPMHAIKRLEKWLQLPRRTQMEECPFYYRGKGRRHEYCQLMFPSEDIVVSGCHRCPCLEYVIGPDRTREVVEKLVKDRLG